MQVSVNLIAVWITVVLSFLCFGLFLIAYREHNPLIRERKKVTDTTNALETMRRLWNVNLGGLETTSEAGAIAVLAGGALFMAGSFFDPVFSPVLGIAGAFLGPRIVSNMIKKRKLVKFREALEPAMEGMLGSLAIGSPLSRALDDGAEFCAEPVKSEFRRMAAEVGTGNDEALVFRGLAERYPCWETQELADAVSFYKSVGGSRSLDLLRATLLNLKEGISSRHMMHQHTKGPRISAVLVTVFPLAYFFLMMFMAPDLFRPLIDTSLGRMALLVGLVLYFVGIGWVVTIIQSVDAD
ncbi:MAG: type II secretion system F family protein [Syntrophomonadales bacterium]|jgi:Flp pilus assembly protein TadB